MAKIKLTKSAVDAVQPQTEVELRDTLMPGFLCKITSAGRKVFMLQFRMNAGERRKPSLELYGELTVEQAEVAGAGMAGPSSQVEPDLVNGKLNPKQVLLEKGLRLVMSLLRMLHVHPEATERRSRDACNNLELEVVSRAQSGGHCVRPVAHRRIQS